MNRSRRIIILLSVAGILAATLLAYLVFNHPGRVFPPPLPEGCKKPSAGFLIIASNQGYNDSIDFGAPARSWPVITVGQGQQVDIVVCNTDLQAHGFQIAHYFDSNIETVAPNQVVHISFIASKAGSYDIYCSIFCSIHPFMQGGLLVVIP